MNKLIDLKTSVFERCYALMMAICENLQTAHENAFLNCKNEVVLVNNKISCKMNNCIVRKTKLYLQEPLCTHFCERKRVNGML
jgi:hypothetical protein